MAGFPRGFLWGAATSAYQIEGSPLADGAGPSNWHLFTHEKGRTPNGENGDVACDHYRRWREDIGLMRDLGLQAYRFSLAWGRILPEGTGTVNAAGLDFYDRLVDRLMASGIQPVPTLFHWDLPAALDERGGWRNRDSADWFADYAAVVFGRLGDRVDLWATLNEPWVVVDAGYVHGVHPPGLKDLAAAPLVTHNLLRAHGQAVRCFRAQSRGRIGIVVNLEPKDPATDAPADLAATRRADAYMNRQYLDPLLLGRYPLEMAEIYGADWPEFPADDFALIGQPVDFIGLNYYTRSVNRHDPAAAPVGASPVRQPGALYTELGWEVHPASLVRVLTWIKDRYGNPPLYITENGAAFVDPEPDADGRIADVLRVDYLRSHLLAAREAIEAGVDLRGYMAWSLLDNFEWACGFAKRFGLYRVDPVTQDRTLKDSGRFYREVIGSNGAILEEDPGRYLP
ncbi:MAG: GH1 family beta-glucosidase [bacterium]